MNQIVKYPIRNRYGGRRVPFTSTPKRYIHHLTAAAGSYYELSSPITLSGDFEIEVILLPETLGNYKILDWDGVTDYRLDFSITPTGIGARNYYRCFINGYETTEGLVAGEVNKVVVKRDNTITNRTALNVTNIVRSYLNTGHLDGSILSLKIWTNGDSNTGTKILDMDFNTNLTSAIVPNAADPANYATAYNLTSADSERYVQSGNAWIGEELVVNGGFDSDTSWTKGAGWSIAGGTATHADGEAAGYLYQSGVLTTGYEYRMAFDVLDAGIGVGAYIGSNTNIIGGWTTDLGRWSVDGVSGGSSFYVRPVSTTTCSVDNISVRRKIPITPQPVFTNIHNLTAAAGSYYELSSPIVLDSDDWEIEQQFSSTTLSTIKVLLGEMGTSDNYIATLGDDDVRVKIDKQTIIDNVPFGAFLDGRLHTLKLKKSNNIVSLIVDGVIIATGQTNNVMTISSIGAHNTPAGYFTGTIRSLRIWKNGDRTNGQCVAYVDFDTDLTSAVVENKATSLGQELVVNGDLATGGTTGWSANNATLLNVDGKLEVTSLSGASICAYQSFSTVIGKQYVVSLDFTKGTAGSYQICRLGTAIGASDVNYKFLYSTGAISFIFTATTTNTFISIGFGITSVGQTSYWDNISIREIPSTHPYLTAYNMTSADAEQMTVHDGYLLGQELLVETSFDPLYWEIADGNWQFISGKAQIISASGGDDIITNNSNWPSVTAGYNYQFTIKVDSLSGGELRMSTYDGSGLVYNLSEGVNYIQHIPQISGNRDYGLRAIVGATATISSYSVKRLINIAAGA